MAPRKKRKPSEAENIKILEELIIDKDKMIIDKDKTIADLDKKLKKKESVISDYKKLCVLTDYNLNRSVSAFDGTQRMTNFSQYVMYLKNTLEARCDSLNEKVNALESELAYKDRVIAKCELEIKQYTAMNDEYKITVEDLKNDQKKKKADCHRLEEKVLEATKWAARLGKVIKDSEIPLCKSDARLLDRIQKQLKQKGSVLKNCDGDQLHESEMLKHNGTQTDESALNSMNFKNYRKVAAYTDGLGVLSPCLTADEGIGLSPGLSEISLATSCSNYKDNFQSYGPLHKEPMSVDDDDSMNGLTTEIIEDSLDHSPATPAFSLFDVQVGNTKATISIGPQFTNDNILNGPSANSPSIDTLNLSNCSVESVKDGISTAHLNDNDDIAKSKNDNLVTIEDDLDVTAKCKNDNLVTIEDDLDVTAKCKNDNVVTIEEDLDVTDKCKNDGIVTIEEDLEVTEKSKNDGIVTIEEDLDVIAKSKNDSVVTIEEDLDESAKRNGLVSSYIFQEGDKIYKMLKYRDHCKIVLPHEEPKLSDGQIKNSDGKSVKICDRLKSNVEALSGTNGKLEECITEKNLKKTLEEVVPDCQESNKLDEVTEVSPKASPMIDKNWYLDPVSGEVFPIREESDKLVEVPPVTEVFSSVSSSSPAKPNGLVSSDIFQEGDKTYKMLKYRDHCKIVLAHEGPQNFNGKSFEVCDRLKNYVEALSLKETLEEVNDEAPLVTEVFSTTSPMIDKKLDVNPVCETVEEVVPIREESDKLDEVTEELSPMIDDKVAVNHENDKVEDCNKRITVCEQMNFSNNINDQLENDSNVSSIVEVNDSCLEEINAVQNGLSVDNKCADLQPEYEENISENNLITEITTGADNECAADLQLGDGVNISEHYSKTEMTTGPDNKCADLQLGDGENVSEDNLITEMTTGADNKCADLQLGDGANISEHYSKTEMTTGAEEIEEGNKALDTLVSSYDEEQSSPSPSSSEHKVGEIVEEEIESMNSEAMQLESTKQSPGSSCASFADLIRDEDNAIDLSINVENVNKAQLNSETSKIEEEKPLTSISSISIGNNHRENAGCKRNFTTESKSIGNNMESNHYASMPLNLSMRQSNHELVGTPTPPCKSIFDNLENVTDLNNPPTNLNIHHKSLHFGDELEGMEQRSTICETKQFKTPLPLKPVKDPDNASKHKNSNKKIAVVEDEVLDKIMRRMQMKSILKGPAISPIPPSPQTSKQGPSIQMELSMLSSDGEKSFAAHDQVGNSSYPIRKEEMPTTKSDESRNAHHTKQKPIITSPKCTTGTSLCNVRSNNTPKRNLKATSKRDHVGNSSYSIHKAETPTTKSDESRSAYHTKQKSKRGLNEIPSKIRSQREEESKSSTSHIVERTANKASCIEDVKPTLKYSCPNVSSVVEFDIDKLLAKIRRDFDVPDCIDELSDSVSVELDSEEVSDFENTLVSSISSDELPPAKKQSEIQFPDVIIAEEMQSPRCQVEEDICEEQTSVLHANKSEVEKKGFSKATENAASLLADNPTETSPGLSKICTKGNKIVPDSAQSCYERAQSSDSTILFQGIENQESKSLENSVGSLAVPDKVSNSDESDFRGSLPNEPMISDDTGHEGEQNTNQSILANDFEQSTLNSSRENCECSKMSDEVIEMDTALCSDKRAPSSNNCIPVNRLEACSLNYSETNVEYPPASKNLSESDGSDFKCFATLNSSEKPVGNSTVSENQLDSGESDFESRTSSSKPLENASVPKHLSDSDESDSKNLSDSDESDFKGWACTSDKRIENHPVSKNLSDSDESDFKGFSPFEQVEKFEAVQLDYGRTTPPNQHCKKEKATRISSNSIQKTGIIQSPSRSYLRLEQMDKCDKFVSRTCGVDKKCNLSNYMSRNVNLRGNSRRTSLQYNNDDVNTSREHKDESEPMSVQNHRNLSNYSKKRIFETSIAENEILPPAKVTKSRKASLARQNEVPYIRSKSVPKDFSCMVTRSGKRILRAGSGGADQIETKSSPSNVSEDNFSLERIPNLDEVDNISTENREYGYRNALKSKNVNLRGRPIRRSSHPFYNSRRRFSQFDEVNTSRDHNDESEPMIVENDRNLSVGRLHDESAKCETSIINECELEHLSSCYSTGKSNESSNEISEKCSCLFVDCVNDSLQDSPLSPTGVEDLHDYAHFKKHSEELLSTDSINTMETNCDISVNVNHDHSYFGGDLQIDCQEVSNDEIPHKNEVENEGEFSSSNCYENDISSLKTYQRHIPVISIEHRKSLRRISRTTSTITSQVTAADTQSSLEIDPPLDETSTTIEPSIETVPTFNFYSEVSEATEQSSNKRKRDSSESLNLEPKIRKIEENCSETISSHPVDAESPDVPKCTEKIKMVKCENVIVTAYDYHRKDLFKGYSKLDQSHPEEECEEHSKVAEEVFTRVARAELENNVANETETCDDSEDSEECEPWTVEVVTECLQKLRGIPNNVIANLIVDTLYNDEGEVDLNGPAPLTDLQKKVLTISCKLCSDPVNHPDFLQSLLSELKRFLLTYEESETVTRYCLYVRFLTILCRIHSEVEEMRSFIYDALYRKKMAGIPMVYTALIMWPPLLPFAQPLETACPLSLGITQVILNHKMNDYNNVYKIRNIEHILRKYYGYVRLEPNEVFKHLMSRINTEGALEAVALLCKKIGPHWTVKFVIEDTLLPILNEYKVNKNNSAAAVNAMRVSSYVLRPLLQGRYIGKLNLVLGTIGNLLTDPQADDMIEAVAAESLCRLSKGNMKLCAELLIKWKPRNGKVPVQLIELMKAFIARQKPVRWLELMTQNNLIKRKGQKSQ